MQEMSAQSARIRGVFVLICGMPILAIGLWLVWFILARPMPDWLPEAITPGPGVRIEGLDASLTDAQRLRSTPGMAGLCVLLLGGIISVQGLIMLILGRRSMALLALLVAMVVGMWAFGRTV